MDGKNTYFDTYLFRILFYAKKINSFKFYIKKVSHNWDTLNIGVKRRDSNPRDFEKSIRFSDERLKPLGHPSTILYKNIVSINRKIFKCF